MKNYKINKNFNLKKASLKLNNYLNIINKILCLISFYL